MVKTQHEKTEALRFNQNTHYHTDTHTEGINWKSTTQVSTRVGAVKSWKPEAGKDIADK